MPKDRPTGTFGGGPVVGPWLEAIAARFRAWRQARTERLNRMCQRQEWLRTASLAPRGSIFPHFPVNAPMPRIGSEPAFCPRLPKFGEVIIMTGKPRIRVPYRREPGPAPIKRDLPPSDTDGVWVH